MSGNSLLNRGEIPLDKCFIAPPFSPIFMMPSHNVMAPTSPRDKVKPLSAFAKVLSIIAGKIDVSP